MFIFVCISIKRFTSYAQCDVLSWQYDVRSLLEIVNHIHTFPVLTPFPYFCNKIKLTSIISPTILKTYLNRKRMKSYLTLKS